MVKGKELKMRNEGALELVVQELAATKGGREVLKYFIKEGMGSSFTTDPVINSYFEGKRFWGRQMFKIVLKNHNDLVQDIIGTDTTQTN